MATRSIIKFEGSNVIVYKHWDGYPSATYPWLAHFNEEFSIARGEDVIYKMAALLRSSILDADKFNLPKDPFTGWGIMDVKDQSECWAEYFYTLKLNGKVEVRTNVEGKPLTKVQLTKEMKK